MADEQQQLPAQDPLAEYDAKAASPQSQAPDTIPNLPGGLVPAEPHETTQHVLPKGLAVSKNNVHLPTGLVFDDEGTGKIAAPPEQKKQEEPSFLDKAKMAVAGPTTALGSPMPETQQNELSGMNDILHGDFKKGGKKIWDAEKISAKNIIPGSPAEWAIRQFDPDFHGGATAEVRAKDVSAGAKPLVDIAQFIDKDKHPIGKALTEVGQGFTSPENLAIMYGTGGLGLIGKAPQAIKAFGVLNKLISAGFAFQAASSAYQHIKAFKDAMDSGDVAGAEYELTHALMSGTIAAQAGTHAAEGAEILNPKTGEPLVKVKAMPLLSETDKAVMGTIKDATTTAAKNVAEFTGKKFSAAADRLGSSLGKSNDFNVLVTRASNMLGKKAAPEFSAKVKSVEPDLKAILNNDKENKIVDPKSAAQAVDRHLKSAIDAPLLEQAARAVQERPTEPVVPNFRERLDERLDKFFKNEGAYYTPAERRAITEQVHSRMDIEHDFGNGIVVPRDPNLVEAEEIRQRLNDDGASDPFNKSDDPKKAALREVAAFMRETIDESYDAKGVIGVKEAREKEANLIDVRDALNDAQGAADKFNSQPSIMKLFSLGKMVGMVGAMTAHFASSNFLAGAIAAGTLWKHVHENNVRDITGNLERAKAVAGREPGAQATVPQPGGPEVQGPSTAPPAPPTAPPGAPQGFPPPPQPPAPVTPPAINHRLYGALSSYFGEFLGARPYQDLLQDFSNQVADMRQDIKDQGGKYTQEQIDKASKLQEKINDAHAQEHEYVEKQNAANKAKYEKEKAKYDDKLKAETAKQEQQRQTEEKQKNDNLKASLLTDERIAHSPVLKATEEPLPIEGLEGRSSEQNHGHEHGHIMTAAAEGLEPTQFVSSEHPDAKEDDAAAQVHIDTSMAEKGPKGIAQKVVAVLGGPAFDEVHHDIKLGRNTGARDDIARARQILREEGGLRGAALEKVFDALYDRAKEHVSNPEALAIAQANLRVREAGLDPRWHMSGGRMTEYVKKLQGAYGNVKTQSTEVLREGDAGRGDEEGESDDTGRATEKQAGTSEGVRAETLRESGEGGGNDKPGRLAKAALQGGHAGGGVASVEELSRPGRFVKMSRSGIPSDQTKTPDFNLGPGEAGYQVTAEGPRLVAGQETPATKRGVEAYHKEVFGKTKAAIKSDDVTAAATKHYGLTDEPRKTGYVLPDGKGLDFSNGQQARTLDHGDVSEVMKTERGANPREAFTRQTKAARFMQSSFGTEVTLPKEGATPEQIDFITRAAEQHPRGKKEVSIDVLGDQGVGGSSRANVTGREDVERLVRDAQRDAANRGAAASRSKVVTEKVALRGEPESDIERDRRNPPRAAIPETVADHANAFNRSTGRPEVDATPIQHSPETASRIARAYEQMPHNPADPAVQKAYGAMKKDLDAQWDYATDRMGIQFEPWKRKGQPYLDSKEMMDDVKKNGHLYFFQGGELPADHPMAEIDPKTGFSYNDKLRAVHDLFGHAAHGFQFGPKGEENAWNVHRQMFSPEAVPAITSETRGQNSWVNFGDHLRNAEGKIPAKGEPGYIPPAQRPYAQNKAGILPEEFHSPKGPEPEGPKGGKKDWAEGVAGNLEKAPAGGVNPNNPEVPSKRYGLELVPEARKALGASPTADDFRNYAQQEDVQGHLATHPDIKLGWDTTGEKPELNVGVSTDDKAKALDVAKKLDQRALWDNQKGEVVPVGGEGKQTAFPDYPVEKRLNDLGIEKVALKKSPKGSSVPLMDNPLPVKGTMEGGEVGTLDLTKALNAYSRKQLPALEPGSEPKEMVDRAKKIAEDEAKYQLAQSKTGTEWYTTEMKEHDKVLQGLRPELAEGEMTAGTDKHPVNLTLFKAAEAILSSGQKPYANVKSALKAWDLYKETKEFPRVNPDTNKSWGPRGVNAYGSAFDSLNKLIQEKGEKGAADWLLSDHPVKELRSYQAPGQSPVKGKASDLETGAMILGAKRGPFMQNLHGIESKFTADMWVSRSWNRWMGTLDLDPRIEEKGKMTSESDVPRNNAERSLMKESFEKTAQKLKLTTSSLQAVLWYYEQALYRAHGIPVESWSFKDAAKRVADEQGSEQEQTAFPFGQNAKESGVIEGLSGKAKAAGRIHALDLLKALR